MALTRESRGFVVRGEFETQTADGGTLIHHSWWYGPDRWANGWGPLDYSVHVFPTRRIATESARQRIGRWVDIYAVQDAVVIEIAAVKARRDDAVAAGRTSVAIACTNRIKELRGLER